MILSVAVLLTGEVFKFVSFVTVYPEVLVYIAALALMGAIGQLFIFFMVIMTSLYFRPANTEITSIVTLLLKIQFSLNTSFNVLILSIKEIFRYFTKSPLSL